MGACLMCRGQLYPECIAARCAHALQAAPTSSLLHSSAAQLKRSRHGQSPDGHAQVWSCNDPDTGRQQVFVNMHWFTTSQAQRPARPAPDKSSRAAASAYGPNPPCAPPQRRDTSVMARLSTLTGAPAQEDGVGGRRDWAHAGGPCLLQARCVLCCCAR